MRLRPPRRLSHGEEATLGEHLEELRGRLIVCFVALGISSAVAFVFHERLVAWLIEPLPPEHRKLLTLGVAEPFTTSLKVSIVAGLAITLPIILWQVWSFLAPAAAEHTQRIVVGFVLFASALLVAGILFGYFLALPAAVHFLTSYDEGLYNVQIRASNYLNFAVQVMVAVGVVFELPIFVLALVRLGVLTTTKLRQNRKLGYFLVLIVAVALPGVDPVTTAMEAIPLFVLYEGSIWLSVLVDRRTRAVPATES
ncbi:MAG: twin-arginine translocase subunit TatC [Actinomycetota bacterium]|nr:twin-arginine translocase subunit TatC [Actinomycetota bacterium]